MAADLNDVRAFVAVARARSFTRAAAQLRVTQSALSHTIRRLEGQVGVRLLSRTTRSVATTEAGERLLLSVGPRLDEIGGELDALAAFRDRPAGTIRINAAEHSAKSVLWPKLDGFLERYPDIKVEVTLDNALTDIVSKRYDAGVRLGDQVAKDMISVRIGPDWRMAIVGTPSYFAAQPPPATPRDLVAHNCINLRLATYGEFYAWEFERAGEKFNVRVEGQAAFSSSELTLAAGLAGRGLACVPEDMAAPHVAEGTLRRVLEEWCPAFSGYRLYYPSRRQVSPAFTLLVDWLRYRGDSGPRLREPRAA
jgi:DNA-binding transcriptional LysR family regulator